MESQPSRLKPLEGERPRSPGLYADEPQDGAQREQPAIIESVVDRPPRRKLPDVRESIIHKFSIGGHVRIHSRWGCMKMALRARSSLRWLKEGSTISGLMDSFAVAISLTLQYGVLLRFLVDEFAHVGFEPNG
jgi:ribonucleoside-diphosphate reductase alpha chain